MVAIINCVLAFSLFASGRSSADVPSCQASGSCDGNDDAMLIQAARSSSATVSKMLRDGQSATQLLDKINDMADRIVTGHEKITDATRLALDSIDGEMDNIITHAKSNSVDFQKVVERAAESIEQCASTTRKAHDKELGEEGIDALAAAVASSRNDHITCRTDEAVLKGDETTKCDALKTYVDGLTMPTCTCSDTPVTKQCVTELSTWSATASSTWSTHQGLCNNATTAQSTKRTACNGQQGALESVFCSYKTSLSLVCRTQDTCRLDEIALRNKAHESVEVSESAFKAEYESAKHVKCILQVLNATDDAKQGMLSDCRSASVDSSNLTITYPPIPGPANCDRSPVSHPPGDDKWRTDEYQGKTWNADGKAPVVATAANCAAEATSTTAAPTTATTPTTTVPALPACGLKFIKFISGQQCNNRRFSGLYVKDASGNILENGCEHTTALLNGKRGPPWSNPVCKSVGTSCTDWKSTLGGTFHREDYNWANNEEMFTNKPGDGQGGWDDICGGVAMYGGGSYQIEFPSVMHISAYAAEGITTGENLYVDTWRLEGSVDGNTWFHLDDKSNGVSGMTPQNTFTGWLPVTPVEGCQIPR